jgi:hypothetical protein
VAQERHVEFETLRAVLVKRTDVTQMIGESAGIGPAGGQTVATTVTTETTTTIDERGTRTKEEKDRRSRKGPPGGDGGGDGDPGGNGGGNEGPRSDDDRLPIWSPRRVPGDSSTSCSERTRSKREQRMFQLPPLPKSAAQLDKYQFAIKNLIALASGRCDRRTAWIDAVAQAKRPEDLEHVPKKCRSLDMKLSIAAFASCDKNTPLYGLLRREGKKSGNSNDVGNGRQCLWRIYNHFALPSMATDGLEVTRTVIDLTAIKLIGGDNGLEDFWNRWRDCVIHVVDLPERMVRQRMDNARIQDDGVVRPGLRRSEPR